MRKLTEVTRAEAASDGAGVKLLRVFGGRGVERFDPFLMLDEFGSANADDYIAGFPPHPHRGFETVTYMLHGKMEHRDHLHNVGLLNDGDVQWMTAARGIIHSEMPKQTEGLMRGFQFWLNLPAAEKMKPAAYQDIAAADIPQYRVGGLWVKAIAGSAALNGTELSGYITDRATAPVLWDMHLPAGHTAAVALADDLNAMVYVYEGDIRFGATPVHSQHLARLNGTGELQFCAGAQAAQVMLIAGRPLAEPVVQYGPFVMNSTAEIEQALQDYRNGVLVG